MEVLFQEFLQGKKTPKILLVGDFFLDHYTLGTTDRISPEAPVPVLRVQSEKTLPGGAGNVAVNLASLGAEVSILGILGEDAEGRCVAENFSGRGIDLSLLFCKESVRTVVKKRVLAQGQQLVRIDYETVYPSLVYSSKIEKALLEVDAVVVSDYGKGTCGKEFLQKLIGTASSLGKRVFVDPKDRNYQKYKGAYLIKPNFKEAIEALVTENADPFEGDPTSFLPLKKFADVLVVTAGEKGAYLFSEEDTPFTLVPGYPKEVKDVTGAGDTFLSVLSICSVLGFSLEEALQAANLASSIVVTRLGCASLSKEDLFFHFFKEGVPRLCTEKELSLFSYIPEEQKLHIPLATMHCMDRHFFKKIFLAKEGKKKVIVSFPKNLSHEFSFIEKIDEIDHIVLL